ncbi:Werner Syndrome-like exonuclease [Brachypodium distachyon]|uniref:3'-5' exonuclease domain-containing protein n=1 Tax=Brachypodium distachyon TaxID=15368 RepID=I1HQ24_BRADI|nr:Werner Syndrome-like exonuclease [Brachypodium distachyon]KQK09032.1 hypothetical protein BRADI_2g45650v3 [Brachypodium distachyon]|eukprot:XP_003566957.1 Werner Syndrome-like exonuclease [Brachypodium distachyon]
MATDTYVTDVTFEENVIITTVTSSGVAVEGWLREIRSFLGDLVVGLDVEWRPSRCSSQNPVALLQLCVGHRCLIFQLLHADFVPPALSEFLADLNVRFVGVGVQDDVERLSDDHELNVANAKDLRELAADGFHMPELRQAGLQAIARTVMGANLQKPQRVRMGPWDAYCLSHEQIKYACIDAFVSFEIGRKLLTGDYPPMG